MLDRFFLAAHQSIIDRSARTPSWWVKRTAWIFIAGDIVAATLTKHGIGDAIFVAVTLALGAGMLYVAGKPELLGAEMEKALASRMVFLGIVVMKLMTFLFQPDAGRALHLVSAVLMVSCNYFAACQLPPSRKRLQSTAA